MRAHTHTHTQVAMYPFPYTQPPSPSTHPPERCAYAFVIVRHTWIPTHLNTYLLGYLHTWTLPGNSNGQKSLESYSPWGCKRVGHDLETKQQCLSSYCWVVQVLCIFWITVLYQLCHLGDIYNRMRPCDWKTVTLVIRPLNESLPWVQVLTRALERKKYDVNDIVPVWPSEFTEQAPSNRWVKLRTHALGGRSLCSGSTYRDLKTRRISSVTS